MGKIKKGKLKQTIINLFNRFFGFEEDIDITNEVKVLHRRNIVLKNITISSNFIYAIILFILATITRKPSDWFFSLLFFPLTFFINVVIKKLIFTDRHDETKQLVAMYLMALYIFASTILFYARFYDTKLEISTYILFYYSIVIVSLYQSKKLTLWSSVGMFITLTIIHFVWTYPIVQNSKGMNFGEFFNNFVRTDAFGDIILRSLIFIIFTIVIYSSVSISEYMQEERRKELLKRSEIQNDFTTTASELLQIVLAMKSDYLDYQSSFLVSEMSKRLAELSGFDKGNTKYLDSFVNIHLKIKEVEDLINKERIEKLSFDVLKEKTSLGKQIAKRVQITQKSDNIIRISIDSVLDGNFINEANKIQNDIVGQIILMSELYMGMRSFKAYKRPYTHIQTVDLFKKQFKDFFNNELLQRFLNFQEDFNNIYINS